MLDNTYYIYQPAKPFKFGHDCRLEMVADEQALQDNLVVLNTVKRKECLMNVDFGTNLQDHVFEQSDIVMWLTLDTAVRDLINTQEERILIQRVAVTKSDSDPDVVQVLVDWQADPSKAAKTTTINYPYGIMP